MSIDRDEIKHLEALARIELGEDERDELAGQLGRIVEFVDKISEADTTGCSPGTVLSFLEELPRRPDEPVESLAREDVLTNAPDSAGGFFRVPGVIKREED